MTKISQLTALGSALAAGDQFFLRDISDASTPIKSVTADNIVELLLYGGDIGTAPNQIPLNQFLGSMAFEDNDAITVGKIAVDVNSAASPSIAISNDPDTGIYSPGDNQLAIATGGTERLRVTSTGQLRLAGAGITFNGDTATANELDDYEEGTWTPAITFATPGDLSVVYSVQQGAYTKVGDTVVAHFRITTSTFTHTTASGALRISGLPFAASASNPNFQGSAFSGFQGIISANYTQYALVVVNGQTYLTGAKNGSGQSSINITTSDMPTGGTVILHATVTYKA